MSSLSFLLLNLCFKYFFIIIISLQKTLYIYIYMLLRYSRNIKEKDQRLVGSESG